MNRIQKSVAALAALMGSVVTGNAFAQSPFYTNAPTAVRQPLAPATVTYRKVCTPTGCYNVPVTPVQAAPVKAAPTTKYRKVCTPTGCYLVPVTTTQAPATPVKNYGVLFQKPSTQPEGEEDAPEVGSTQEGPFYGDEPIASAKPKVNSGNVRPAVKTPVRPASNSVPKSLPSPFYP